VPFGAVVEDQRFLAVRHVREQGGDGHVRLVGDLRDGDAVVAVLGEQPQRRVRQRPAGLCLLALAAPHRRRHASSLS
jgi:hypothetical protein